MTKKLYDEKKEWQEDFNKYTSKNAGEHQQEAKVKIEKEVIEQKCANIDCDSTLCNYTALQTRGADEGQTIFYQCVKCGERFKLNN